MTSRRRLKVLVVDDNRSSADTLARLLRKQGDDVDAVYDGGMAIESLQQDPPDVVLTDLKMEPVDGMAVLQAARAMRPPVDTIVFTAYGAVDVAVRAMHMGARDFLTKPVTLEQVASRLEQIRTGTEDGEGSQEGEEPIDEAFVAHSQASRALLQLLERAAGVPSPVWIEGELGSGRSHCARTLHGLGGAQGAFTCRNLARDEPWPSSGMVLLPNVDDLHEDLQRDLFRQLQTVPPGVRVVATASTDGRRRVAEGHLRPELYYRLAVVVIQVPPLRRRPEDIVPLFRKALRACSRRYNREAPVITAEMRDQLVRHYWPGNTRELLNLAERSVVMGANGFHLGVIEDASSGLPKLEPGFSLATYLETVERRILVEALRRAAGDRSLVGKLLGVERNTLRYKLNKYDLLDK